MCWQCMSLNCVIARVKYKIFWVTGILLILMSACIPKPSVVKAILFYAPSCTHCADVVNNTITSVQSNYDHNLNLVWIDVTGKHGRDLYEKCIAHYNTSPEQITFPIILIGDQILFGSKLINNFPSAVQTSIDTGGLDWPKIDGFECSPDG